MQPEGILSYVLGPLGAVAVMALLVIALVRQQFIVPWWVYEASAKRVELLDGENSELNHSVLDLTKQNAEMRVEMRLVNQEVQRLREEVAALKQKVNP